LAPREKEVLKNRKGDWSLYILECDDGSFYTGISNDPQKRFEAHRAGKGARYTKLHPPLRILVIEILGSYPQALRREYQVKQLSKKAKIAFLENTSALPLPEAKAAWQAKKKLKRKKRPRAKRRRASSKAKE
jgi:putative endonuclease